MRRVDSENIFLKVIGTLRRDSFKGRKYVVDEVKNMLKRPEFPK